MKKIWSVGFVAAVMALCAPARAFYVESREIEADGGAQAVVLRYDTSVPVQFRIGSDGLEGGDGSEFDAIANAFQTWGAVECANIDFTEGDRVERPDLNHATANPEQRYILVFFSDSPAYFGETTNVAQYHLDRSLDTGELIGGTIVLNARAHSWSTTGEEGKLDVQSIVTAMIGRTLGITSDMEGNATYPAYAAGDTSKRTLGSDDIAALTYLYPAGGDECAVAEPQEICDGTTPDGGVECPPRASVTDGGVGTRTDGGDIPDVDSGSTGSDAGGGGSSGDDGGCNISKRHSGLGGLVSEILAIGCALALSRRRKR